MTVYYYSAKFWFEWDRQHCKALFFQPENLKWKNTESYEMKSIVDLFDLYLEILIFLKIEVN